MNYCKVCDTPFGVTQEHLLDGRPVYVCGKCRRYYQGMLRSCETCSISKDCPACGILEDGFVCDGWKDYPRRRGNGKA